MNPARARSLRTSTLCIVTMLLIVPAPVGSAEPSAGDGGLEPNVLVVNADNGQITRYQDKGSTLTDIQVTNAPASGNGFTLYGPSSTPRFINQSSRSDGVLEFWSMVLVPGAWIVVQGDGEDEKTLVTFIVTDSMVHEKVATLMLDVPSVSPGTEAAAPSGPAREVKCTSAPEPSKPAAPLGADGAPDPKDLGNPQTMCGGGVPGSGGGGGGGGDPCYGGAPTYQLQEQKTLWTPFLMAHAPKGGSGTANSQWTRTVGIYVSNFGWSSSYSGIAQLNPSDGGTIGWFQLARWGFYARYEYQNCQVVMTGHSQKVLEWYEIRGQFNLWGPSRATDADDVTYFTAGGYNSVVFNYRYWSPNAIVTTQSGGASLGKSGNTVFNIEAFINGWTWFDSAKAYAQDGSGVFYTYTFPSYSTVKVDYIEGNNEGWAFCHTAYASCG